jgi:hypothetical protein
LETITTNGHDVDFGENSLSVSNDNKVYNITDSTTITLVTGEENIVDFEKLKNAYQNTDGYMVLEIQYKYNETSQQYEVSSILAKYIDGITTQPSLETITTKGHDVSFDENSLSVSNDTIVYNITDSTTIQLEDEYIDFEELKSAYQSAKGYMVLEIQYYYNETSQQYEVYSIWARYVDYIDDPITTVATVNTITVTTDNINKIQSIDTTEKCIEIGSKCIEIGAEDLDGFIPLYATDDTIYSGIVSSFNDLEQYKECYQSVMLTTGECVEVYYVWTIKYHVTTKNVIDSINVSIYPSTDDITQ